MGYTHYFTRNNRNKGSAFMFGKLALDAKAVIAEASKRGIVIRGGLGTGEPDFTEGYFSLNGDEQGETDLAHETFHWEALPEQPDWQRKHFVSSGRNPDDIFNFCKTAYKPYDAVVTAILIRAKVIYGKLVDIRSDGGWSEWQAGRDLYEATFGEQAPCPFEMATA